jgi:hypothetical protein
VPEVKPWQIDVPQAEKISKNPSRMHESCNITDVIDTDREPECSTSGSSLFDDSIALPAPESVHKTLVSQKTQQNNFNTES